jgi:hypothetical protein
VAKAEKLLAEAAANKEASCRNLKLQDIWIGVVLNPLVVITGQ